MNQPFATAEDFRRSLEERLKRRALKVGRALERERQLVVFERYLARLFDGGSSDLVVKGGLAIELRTARARTTKDVDLRALGSPTRFREFAVEAGHRKLGDFLSFRIEPHPHHPEIQAAGMQYDGHRYRAQGFLAGKVYGNPFSVDVAFGEPMIVAPDVIQGRADLTFVGLESPAFRVYPRAVHLAEKLHAYTVPRPSLNSRVKDLPDIAILASLGPFDSEALRLALERTFEHRATHALPGVLPAPPVEWRGAYERMAILDGLPWKSLEAAYGAVKTFLEPVLSRARGVWSHQAWTWQSTGIEGAQNANPDYVFERSHLKNGRLVAELIAGDGTRMTLDPYEPGGGPLFEGDRVRLRDSARLDLVSRARDRGHGPQR